MVDDAKLSCCQAVVRKVCAGAAAELRGFTGESGQVHPLAEHPPKVAMPALVNSLKGVPTRTLRSEYTGQVNRASLHGHFWSPSYVAASCGGAPLNIIRQHIDQQQRPA